MYNILIREMWPGSASTILKYEVVLEYVMRMVDFDGVLHNSDHSDEKAMKIYLGITCQFKLNEMKNHIRIFVPDFILSQLNSIFSIRGLGQ
jgi:hypothetical protein